MAVAAVGKRIVHRRGAATGIPAGGEGMPDLAAGVEVPEGQRLAPFDLRDPRLVDHAEVGLAVGKPGGVDVTDRRARLVGDVGTGRLGARSRGVRVLRQSTVRDLTVQTQCLYPASQTRVARLRPVVVDERTLGGDSLVRHAVDDADVVLEDIDAWRA